MHREDRELNNYTDGDRRNKANLMFEEQDKNSVAQSTRPMRMTEKQDNENARKDKRLSDG